MTILLFVLMALAVYDAIHTTRMLRTHGIEAELNPMIPMLARKLGSVRAGVWAGIMIPSLALAGLGFLAHPVIDVTLTVRGLLFGMQIYKGQV